MFVLWCGMFIETISGGDDVWRWVKIADFNADERIDGALPRFKHGGAGGWELQVDGEESII